jgi:hypothetical protein
MTSCVSETLQDWDIRTEPGDGGDIRPENGGDALSLFRSGRVKSSSRAELREEVPGASACGLHVSHWVQAKQGSNPCLIWRKFVVHRWR